MARLPDPLSAAALAYLALPAFAFLLGWLELPLGLAATGLLAFALFQLATQLPPRPLSHNGFAAIFLVALALLWAALGGAGHLVYANIDWGTRDTVYADLILGTWPPSYGLHEGSPLVLRTAMGYFLPPAAAAKVAGIEWATTLLLAWTAIGVALFLLLLPLPRQFGLRLVLLALLAIFFSGMDYLAILLTLGHVPIFPFPLEWWGKWTYSSLTAQLFWAPNHALALWLGAALFFRHRNDSTLPSLALVLLPLLLLWTPFAPMGLLPWFIWGTWRLRQSWPDVMRGTTRAQWAFATILVVVLGGLFASKGVPADYSTASTPGGAYDTSNSSALELALSYIQFTGCEFLILAILLIPFVKDLRQEFAIATGLLLAMPLIKFGPSNDWVLRASTPSLVILMIVTLHVIGMGFDGRLAIRRLIPVLLVLLIGAITPSFEFARAMLWRQTQPNYGVSLVEQQHGFLAPHYIGRLDRAELQTIFRTPGLVPDAAKRQILLPPGFRHRQ